MAGRIIAEFIYKAFPCIIIRHPTIGHLCGYVGLPRGDPWHGKDYVRAELKGIIEQLLARRN